MDFNFFAAPILPFSRENQASSGANSFLDLHRRLGHIGVERDMGAIKKGIAVPSIEMPAPLNKQCTTCLVSKAKCAPIEKLQRRLTRPLELTHTDMSGKIGVPSLGGAHFFVVFLDDRTRMSSVYFWSEKSQFLGSFQAYKALAENESSMNLRLYRMRLDNAGEQNSEDILPIL